MRSAAARLRARPVRAGRAGERPGRGGRRAIAFTLGAASAVLALLAPLGVAAHPALGTTVPATRGDAPEGRRDSPHVGVDADDRTDHVASRDAPPGAPAAARPVARASVEERVATVPARPPIVAQARPRSPSDASALVQWLGELGLHADEAGMPCLTNEASRLTVRVRSGRTGGGGGGVIDGELERLFDALDADLDGDPLEAGVSRDWAQFEFSCDTGVPRADVGAPAAAVEQGLFVVADTVPAGFESLAIAQSVRVDIRFNDRLLGDTMITGTADEIRFDTPGEVAAMLTDVEDIERLTTLLSEPFSPNTHLVCFRENDPAGCGRIEPAPVAVIYDEYDSTLDLFVASALQRLQTSGGPRYLERPEEGQSSILSLYSVASDPAGGERSLDLSARLLVGYGDGYLSASGSYGTGDDPALLNELKITHHFRDHAFTAGTYDWSPGGALNDISLTGVGFVTSFHSRTDLAEAFSTPLIVPLQRRAIVQLLVDGRVFSGNSYAAGNQVLDTSALPGGTYPVEVRVIENDGTTRSEFRTFTRSRLIPPRGEPVFSATTGVARLNGELLARDTEPLVAGFTIARRIGQRSALTLGAVQLDRDSLGQSDFLYLGERLSAQAGLTVGGRSTYGATANLALALPGATIGASWRRFDSDIERDTDRIRESLYPPEGTQWGASINRTYGRLGLGLSTSRRFTRIDNGAVLSSVRTELQARRAVLLGRGLRGFVSASLRDTNGERFGVLRFDLSFDRTARLSAGLGLDVVIDRDRNVDLTRRATLDYDGSNDSFDWNASAYASRSRIDSAGAQVVIDHPSFAASAAHGIDFASDGSRRASSVAAFSTHIGIDREGAAIGRAGVARSGVIVAVEGSPAGDAFDILVNGITTTRGEIGTPRFIGLRPFDAYTVELVPRGLASNGLSDEVHEFTLYPGTVERVTVVAQVRLLMIMAIVDAAGEPLGNAVVQTGDNPSITDDAGLLQAEVSPGDELEVQPLEGPACRIVVPEATGDDGDVIVVDDVVACVGESEE